MNENMNLYNRFRVVPEEAKKPISAGRLKGFTDINPMWRIKVLTEEFGPCGFGWYTEIVDKRTETIGEESCVFVSINLYVKMGNDWSKPIYGTGGSKLSTKEKSGVYVSDECFKMAYTDAISVACKNLGIGADVYYQKDRTKYNNASDDQPVVVTDMMIKTLMDAARRKDLSEEKLLKWLRSNSLKEITVEKYKYAMSKMGEQ